jgi:galactokinase/mevalonate kinase-like predicted kinase
MHVEQEKRYLVKVGSMSDVQQWLNQQAEEGYRLIMMSSVPSGMTGGSSSSITITVIMEKQSSTLPAGSQLPP